MSSAHPSAAPASKPSIINSIFFGGNKTGAPMNEVFGQTAIGDAVEVDSSIRLSTLANGIRVASCDSNTAVSNVGVFIDSGSRYETPANSGISHFLESMAFKSTESRSDFKLVRDMSAIGANITATASRENMVYRADGLRTHVNELVETLGDVIQNNSYDVGEVKEVATWYKAAQAERTKTADLVIMEGIHEAAYANNTLGNPLYASAQNVDYFDSAALKEFVRTQFTNDRVVVAGVGVNHNELCDLVKKNFTGLSAAGTGVPKEAAQYTGGEVRYHNRDEPLTHFALAFETASWHHEDLVPMCVLQMIMGGGGSFSAGGPGKGMYSRLFERVLNQHGWVESATCFNSIFDDSSLFGIYGSCAPQDAAHLVNVISQEALNTSEAVDATELSRAKNQLRSAVLMQLEQRGMQFEDIGRQVSTYGEVRSPTQICAQIDAVTEKDIRGVAAKMLATTPSVAAYGNLSALPRYDVIARSFQ